jgi:hypothetical protein
MTVLAIFKIMQAISTNLLVKLLRGALWKPFGRLPSISSARRPILLISISSSRLIWELMTPDHRIQVVKEKAAIILLSHMHTAGLL